MTDIQACLAQCDKALAAAERLIAVLNASEVVLEPELSAARERIAVLRREVERLRGMVPPTRARTKAPPNWSDLSGEESPWGSLGAGRKRGG